MDLAGLASSDWRVRHAAVEAMAGLADLHSAALAERLVELVRASSGELSALNSALDVLVRMDADVVLQRLAPLADHPLSEARQAVAAVLSRFSDPRATEVLLRLLSDDNENVRYHAVEALGVQGARAAVPPLLQLVRSGDFFLGFVAAEALGRIGDPAAVAALIPLVEDEYRAAAAVEALGRLGHRAAVPPLAEGLESGALDPLEAAVALDSVASAYEEEIGSATLVERLATPRLGPRAEATLLELAGRAQNLSDRQAASLPRLLEWRLAGTPARASILEALQGLMDLPPARSAAARALRRAGADAAPAFRRLLDHRDAAVRRMAAEAVGELGGTRAVAALVPLLDHRDPTTAAAAARALGRLGDERAREPLLNRLHHPNTLVRHELVEAGQALGPVPRVRLLAMLEDPDAMRRCGATQWLGASRDPEVLRRLRGCLHDPNAQVRRVAVESLAGSLGHDPSVVGILTEALRSGPPEVRAAAARGLERGPVEAAPALLEAALRDPNLWTRLYASRSLARVAGADHAESLALLTRDASPPVRAVAAEALGRVAGDDHLHLLLELLRDPEPDVVLGVLAGLHGCNPEAVAAFQELCAPDREPRVRRAAVAAVARCGGAGAVEVLRAALDDPALHETALDCLLACDEEGAEEPLASLWIGGTAPGALARSLARAGERAVGPVARVLERSAAPEDRVTALRLLRAVPGEAALGLLAASLLDENPRVRAAAFLALCDRPGREVLRRVVDAAAAEKDVGVRAVAEVVERTLREDLAG